MPGARQDRRKASRRKAGNGGRIRERLINTRSWYRTYPSSLEGNDNSEGSRSALVTEGEIGCGVCVAVPQQTTDHPSCAPLACFAVHFDYIALGVGVLCICVCSVCVCVLCVDCMCPLRESSRREGREQEEGDCERGDEGEKPPAGEGRGMATRDIVMREEKDQGEGRGEWGR